MLRALRLLGHVPSFQAVQKCSHQSFSSASLGSLARRVVDIEPGLGGLPGQAVHVFWPLRRVVAREPVMDREDAWVKLLNQPQGVFKGYTIEDPREYPTEGQLVSFQLKPDVPFETLVRLDAASQGLCNFYGQSFKGLFFYPDVRKMANQSAQPFSRPWTAFADCLPEYPFTKLRIIVATKEAADALEAALRPYSDKIKVSDLSKAGRPKMAVPS